MTTKQIDRLIGAIREKRNPTAMGLDTRIEYVPEALASRHPNPADAVYHFNAALLEGLSQVVPCVKIQAAYYELMGTDGMACMRKTAAEARRLGYVVILDAKRGDIGATAAAYSAAYLGEDALFEADFLTVNPYLGYDGIEPFVADCARTGRGIFVLVKTSNPSSGEFQDVVTVGGKAVYQIVGEKVSEWGMGLQGAEGYSSIGAVVGATYPEQGKDLRGRMPGTFFLVPGYGAQGATAADLAGCFDEEGGGAVVNASRSLICAYRKNGNPDFVAGALAEAIRMRDELRSALNL